MAAGKFIIRNTASGIKFDLKATNGQVIATSQVYKSEKSCNEGVQSVKKNSLIANIEDLTLEGHVEEKCPKFEIYADKAGDLRFRLKAKNGQIIAVSEAYKSMAACRNGIESVQRNASEAEIVKE